MNDISNRALVYLLMVAIFVSLVGTLVGLSKLGELGVTGLVGGENNGTGQLNLTVTETCAIAMSGADINFGTGTVNGSECILNTSAGTKSSGCSSGINAVTTGLNFTNTGNENITLNLTSNNTATAFLGDGASFKINANIVGSHTSACNSGNFALADWQDIGTSRYSVCNSTNQLEADNSKDTIEIDVYLSIPDDTGGAGGVVELTMIGICE